MNLFEKKKELEASFWHQRIFDVGTRRLITSRAYSEIAANDDDVDDEEEEEEEKEG